MRSVLSLVAVLGLAVGAFADVVPTHVGPVFSGPQGDTHTVPPPQPVNPGEIICDQLNIGDTQSYDTGNGDAWSGQCIFGFVYDLQCADDCNFEGDCCLSDCTADYASFGCGGPCDMYVGVFADAGGCVPNNAADSDGFVSVTVGSFNETLFFLVGVRITAHCDGSGICGNAGNNFIVLQPHDQNTCGSDWYYIIRDINGSINGCGAAIRDGGRDAGGYGFTDWRNAGAVGFGDGDCSQQISVKCGPQPNRCVYQVTAVKIKKNICGNPSCSDCPYSLGDIVCSKDTCDTRDQCAGKLKGVSACPNGGICTVIANLVDCTQCPRGAKRCK